MKRRIKPMLGRVLTWLMAALLVAGLVPVLPEAPFALAEDAGAAVELGGEGQSSEGGAEGQGVSVVGDELDGGAYADGDTVALLADDAEPLAVDDAGQGDGPGGDARGLEVQEDFSADTAEAGDDAQDNDPSLATQSVSVSNPRVVAKSGMEAGQVSTWDCVWFGSYPQTEVAPGDSVYATLQGAAWDANGDATVGGKRYRRISKSDATYSGWWEEDGYGSAAYRYFRYEPIKWRVLKVSGSTALVVADRALDDRPYNTNFTGVTWATSSVRSWLNGYGAASNQPGTDYTSKSFIGAAFSASERAAILTTDVANADNTYYGTAGGAATRDRVFLLSEAEAFASSHGFASGLDTHDEARRCSPVDFARAMGAWTCAYSGYYGDCCWWLRSPGYSSCYAASVGNGGYVDYSGCIVYDDDLGAVRPAMNLDLASAYLSWAGTVSSDGAVDEVAPPSPVLTTDISKATVSAIADQTYTGSAIKPTPIVTLEGKALVAGTDYTLSYTNNVNVGTATVTATGKNGYTGKKSATFNIVPKKVTPTVTLSKDSFTYNGSAQRPTATVKVGSATLAGGTDYDLTWSPSGCTDAGTYTVKATLKGNYSGSATASFTISPKNVSSCTVTLSPSSYTYDGAQKSPTVTVKDGSVTLTQGTHYSVATPNGRTNAGTYTYTVAGKGNYTGNKTVTLTITPRSITTVSISEVKNQTYTGSAIKPAPTVEFNGRALVRGTDYELSWSQNTVDVGTASVTIAGRGNFQDSLTSYYRILPKSLASCTVTVSPSSYTYDGTQKNPTVTVKDGSKTLAKGTDYDVEVPSGRTNAGTYTYTLTGKGNYTGTKSATFMIQTAKTLTLGDLSFSFSNSQSAFGYSENYRIPYDSYRIVFGETMAQYWYRYYGLWGGSCHGMSAMARMLNVSGSGLYPALFNSNAGGVGDLSPSNKNRSTGRLLKSYIEAMQVSQMDSAIQSERRDHKNDLESLCNAVLASKRTGRLVDIGVYGRIGSDLCGHSIVGYDVQTVSSTQKRIYVYDCNFPKAIRYITVSTNSSGKCTGWYYRINDRYDWGSSYSGSYINYTSYDAVQSVWNGGGGTHLTNVVATNSRDFEITDGRGELVARVEKGELKEAANDVWQFVPTGITVDGNAFGASGNVLLFVPSDAAYSVKNEDESVNQLDVGMVNEKQSATVVTDATEVTFAVNDGEELNLVDVEAGAGDTYSVTLNSELESAKGQESIELSGMGNGQRTSVGTVSGSCVIVNGRTASLTVNGESVDIGSRIGISPKDATLEYVECTYDGKAKEPKVTVRHSDRDLVEDRDFVVKYSSNVEPGTATVTVYGIGDYDGKVELTFAIKAKQVITATDKTVEVGKTVSLGAKTSGDGKLTYKSSDTKVATVSAKGVVTGVSVGVAKMTVTASETDSYKKATKTVTVTVTQPAPSFSDVTDKTAHVEDIAWLADSGISKGWGMPDGTVQFRPYANVARADMAAFLFRLARSWGIVADGWKPAGTASFGDVTAKTAHYDEIMWLAESGISQGWAVKGGKEFRPYANVARADMAAFLNRLAQKAGIKEPTGGGVSFKDVTAKTAHADDISWLAATGVSKGWSVAGGYEFRPLANVARADMAAFLHRMDALR